MTRKAFTLQEANRLVPRMEEVMERIAEHRDAARRHHEKVQVLDALWGERVRDRENPDHEEFREHRRAIRRAEEAVGELVREEILGRGIRFPAGGVEHGLVDFPTTYRGRWIYLCWERGEPEVRYWHEVDGGYRGRREIGEEMEGSLALDDDPARDDDSALDF